MLLGVALGVAGWSSGSSGVPVFEGPAQKVSFAMGPVAGGAGACDAQVVRDGRQVSHTVVAFCTSPVQLTAAGPAGGRGPELLRVGRWSLTDDAARRLSVSLVAAGLLVGAALAHHVRKTGPSDAAQPVQRGYLQRRQLLDQARRDRRAYLDFLEATPWTTPTAEALQIAAQRQALEAIASQAYGDRPISEVIRPAAVLPETAAHRILAELSLRDARATGLWIAEPSRWDRYDRSWDGQGTGPGHAQLLGSLQVVYGRPGRYEITVFRATITSTGAAAGWRVQSLCDEAFSFGGLTLASCPRASLAAPPLPFRLR